MRFYRGIAVPLARAEFIVATIRSEGLRPGDGRKTMLVEDLKPRLAELRRRPSITMDDTRRGPDYPAWVCACAEPDGALYYACRHHIWKENNTPLLIEFEAPLADAIVDGNDFLYTMFQLGDPPVARAIAESIFGLAVLEYIDRAWSTQGRERIAICDLAVQDEAVIMAHAKNRTVIAGRHGTRFRSAFLVKAPVTAARIVAVRIVDEYPKIPEAEVELRHVVKSQSRG